MKHSLFWMKRVYLPTVFLNSRAGPGYRTRNLVYPPFRKGCLPAERQRYRALLLSSS